jgi:hypothetical protein
VQRVVCARFLPHWRAASAGSNIVALGYSESATDAYSAVPFPTPARANVSGVVVSANSDFAIRRPGATVTPSAITFNQGGLHGCLVNMTITGSTAGFALQFFSTGAAGAYPIFTGAEL